MSGMWLRCGGVLVLVAGSMWGCARGAVPVYPPLSSQTRQLSAAATPVHLLEVKDELVFDELGNWKQTFTQRYRILNKNGVESWGGTGAGWSPWYMTRPKLMARVEDPEGAVRELDQRSVAELPAFPDVPDVYSDRRLLRAPLPGVRVGSVVTESFTRQTTRPFFKGGASFSIPFQSQIPRDKVELVIDLPENLPFRYEVLDVKVDRKETIKDKRRRIVFTGHSYPAVEELDDYAPPGLAAWPSVAFSTGDSWQVVAAAYEDKMDEQLKNDAGVPELARQSVGSAQTPAEKANQLLAALHARVRYSSIAFGQAAIIPGTPVDTLRRTYGDCKDQSLVLVAMLRAVGLPATLALLRPGPGEDVRARLPALDAFTHAIVVVPGEHPLWIDPTSDHARAGELPEGDQGRLALIIDGNTRGLVMTPVSSSAENTYLETREVRLQEQGPALVHERSSGTGLIDQASRNSFASTEQERTAGLVSYVKDTYEAERLVSSRFDNLDDFRKPLGLTLQASGAKVGQSNLFHASSYTDYRALTSWLPEVLFGDEPRNGDFLLPFRYRAEIRYLIVPPRNFKIKSLPETPAVDLGPGRLTRSYREARDGAVEASLKLEIDKRQLSASELAALRLGFKTIAAEQSDWVEFSHESELALQEGRTQDALRILRTEAAAEPRAAAPLMRWALDLIDLGFVDVARQKARAAIALDPSNATAQRTLGLVLERDELGRRHAAGFDRVNAKQAFERAIDLDPDDTQTRVELGILLEHDQHGVRYGNPAELQQAIAVYDAIAPERLAAYEEGSFAWNVLYALLYAERYEELGRRIAKLKPADVPHMVAIAVAANSGGGRAGIAEADRRALQGSDRSEALSYAAEALARARHYAEASALFEGAAKATPNFKHTRLAQLLRSLTRLDASQLKQDRPEALVKKLQVLALSAPGEVKAAVSPLLSSRASTTLLELSLIPPFMFMHLTDEPLPRAVLADLSAHGFKSQVEGSDAIGYRIRVSGHGFERLGDADYYVLKEPGGYRLRAGGQREQLGCEALFQLKAKNDKAARQWLAWAHEGMKIDRDDGPLGVPPTLGLWNDGKGKLDLAAAALCNSGELSKEALRLLIAARGSKGVDETALELAIADSFQEPEVGLASAERLVRLHPKSKRARQLLMRTLNALGRHEAYEREAQQAISLWSKSDWERSSTISLLASMQERRGRLKEARTGYKSLLNDDSSFTKKSALADLAWNGLFIEPPPSEILQQALDATEGAGDQFDALAILACVQLELGKVDNAQVTFKQLIEAHRPFTPAGWYAMGRLAEAYGMLDTARAAYGKIEEPKKPNAVSAHHLVQRRLKLLASGSP